MPDKKKINYEVHILKGSSWQIKTTFEQEREALDFATSLLESNEIEGARVVQESLKNDGLSREKIIFEEKDLEKLGSKIVGLCVVEDDYEELVDENYLYGDFCELGASLEIEPRKDTYEELLEIFERLKNSLL